MSKNSDNGGNNSAHEVHHYDDRSALARRVFPGGSDPDPRFTLANERTFLAWTRTSLAFLAGGIVLEAFPIGGMSEQVHSLLANLVIAIGTVIGVTAAIRWWRVEMAMRHKKPLPLPVMVPLLGVGALGACAVGVLMVLA